MKSFDAKQMVLALWPHVLAQNTLLGLASLSEHGRTKQTDVKCAGSCQPQ